MRIVNNYFHFKITLNEQCPNYGLTSSGFNDMQFKSSTTNKFSNLQFQCLTQQIFYKIAIQDLTRNFNIKTGNLQFL